MLGIGEFARRGRISVRMLRHYDAMGLLTPAHVDEWTGRRAYEVSQLARLNRLVVLKELGFSLQQVKTMLDDSTRSSCTACSGCGGWSSRRRSTPTSPGWPRS